MQIPKKVWQKYKDALAAVDQKAAAKMEEYIRALGEIDSIPWSAVQYAAALTDVYGEAAGAAACEMYDATAEASGAKVKPAEMAELPKIGEVAKVVRGAFKNGSEKVVPGAVGRMVKQVGADTTLKNAQRDGAEFAWIPAGDTCAFCLTLASRGWQKISKKSLKNGHAEHIHANCDCTYAVRFDKKTTVEGYEPEKYREMYENAEGETAAEKMNSMRRGAERGVDKSGGNGIIKPDRKRASSNDHVNWPPKGEKISIEQYKDLREFAKERGLSLRGFKDSDVDVDLVKQSIRSLEKVTSEFPELLGEGKKRLTIQLTSMQDDDYASTNPVISHVIFINEKTYRSWAALKSSYENGLKTKWFVQGTSELAILQHEAGHLYQTIHSIPDEEIKSIAIDLLNTNSDDLSEKLKENLSEYSSVARTGGEILSEVFAGYFGSDNPKSFILSFMRRIRKR